MFTNSTNTRFLLIILTSFFSILLFSKTELENREKYINIVNAWNNAHNNWNFKKLNKLYSKEVWYYCEKWSKEKCIGSKSSQVSPSKVFVQKIVSEIEVSKFAPGYFKCEFTKRVNYDGELFTYPAYLILSDQNDKIQIVAESDNITDRRLKFKLTPNHLIVKQSNEGFTSEKVSPARSNSTPWIILILLIGILIYLFRKSFTGTLKNLGNKQENAKSVPPTEDTKKENQLDSIPEKAYTHHYFKKLIISKFGHNFKVNEKGPRYRNNYYPPDRYDPELLVEFSYNDYHVAFYVHPVFIKTSKKQTIELIPEREHGVFQTLLTKAPPRIYFVLGTGTDPEHPDEIFVIPYKEANSNTVNYSDLKPFRFNANLPFYFDMSAYKLIMKR